MLCTLFFLLVFPVHRPEAKQCELEAFRPRFCSWHKEGALCHASSWTIDGFKMAWLDVAQEPVNSTDGKCSYPARVHRLVARQNGNYFHLIVFTRGEYNAFLKSDSCCRYNCTIENVELSIYPGLTSLFTENPDTPEYWNDDLCFGTSSIAELHLENINRHILPRMISAITGQELRILNITSAYRIVSPFNLTNLQKLKVVIFRNVGFARNFPEEFFDGAQSVEFLHISSQHFNRFPKSMKSFKNLLVLQLNELRLNINLDDLSSLQSLQEISISNSIFSNLTLEIPLLQNLKHLKIVKCKGINLTNESFKKAKFLESVTLIRSHIEYLPENLFADHANLKLVDFSMNKLTGKIIMNLGRTHTLNLSFNKIEDIVNSRINGQYLENLNLANNSLKVWNEPQLQLIDKKLLPGLQVNLSDNQLITINYEMIGWFTQLRSVDLNRNPIDCSNCNTPQLIEWLEETDMSLLCAYPLPKRGIPIRYLNFNEPQCSNRDTILAIAVPVAVLAVVILLSITLMHFYRFEISYMLHLFRVRKRGAEPHIQGITNYKYDAFICYSANNRRWVIGRLLPLLENCSQHYRLCLHERDFPLGSRIVENIVDAIESSRKVIIVLSKDFINSKWCQWELDMANHKTFDEDRNFIILLQVETLDRNLLPRHLKYLMDTRTYLEWPEDPKDESGALQRLSSAIGESLSNTVLSKQLQFEDTNM